MLQPTPELPDDTPLDNVDCRLESAACWRLLASGQSARPVRFRTKCCSALTILAKYLLRIFAGRWVCHQPMASGRRAKSQPDLLI
jgi:hypothetical protein